MITAKRQVTPAGRDSNGNVDPKFSCYLSDCQYTSARLSTKSPTGGYLFTAQGARFEARIKLAEGVGAWSRSGCWAPIRRRGPRRARSISPSPKDETLEPPSRRLSTAPPKTA